MHVDPNRKVECDECSQSNRVDEMDCRASMCRNGFRMVVKRSPESLAFQAVGKTSVKWALRFHWAMGKRADVTGVTDGSITYCRNGSAYRLRANCARFVQDGANAVLVLPENNTAVFVMGRQHE